MIRPARQSDLETFGIPPQRSTIRGLVAEVNGEPQAMIGLMREKNHYILFSEYRPEFREGLRSMGCRRAIREVMSWIEELNSVVYAVAKSDELTSQPLLVRMGFNHFGRSEFGEVYKWHP